MQHVTKNSRFYLSKSWHESILYPQSPKPTARKPELLERATFKSIWLNRGSLNLETHIWPVPVSKSIQSSAYEGDTLYNKKTLTPTTV